MGVIPLKIQREMPAVGSTSYRKMQGTKCRLEHLMRHRGLQSVRNNYGTHEATFSRVEIKGTYGIYFSNIKTPLFSSNRRRKPEFLGAIVGIRGPKIYVRPWACPRRISGPKTDQQ